MTTRRMILRELGKVLRSLAVTERWLESAPTQHIADMAEADLRKLRDKHRTLAKMLERS